MKKMRRVRTTLTCRTLSGDVEQSSKEIDFSVEDSGFTLLILPVHGQIWVKDSRRYADTILATPFSAPMIISLSHAGKTTVSGGRGECDVQPGDARYGSRPRHYEGGRGQPAADAIPCRSGGWSGAYPRYHPALPGDRVPGNEGRAVGSLAAIAPFFLPSGRREGALTCLLNRCAVPYLPYSSAMTTLASWPKFFIGWVVCFALRFATSLNPAFANIEPVTATLMPFGRRFGVIGGFAFGFLSMVLFDAVTSGIGVWTWVTAFTFGAMGIAANLVLGRLRGTWWQYVLFTIIATILYDLITGVFLGPVLFGGSMREAFMGQIPFTLRHLLGNIILAAVLSPAIDRWVVRNERLQWWPGTAQA
jgi:hypothetical protein